MFVRVEIEGDVIPHVYDKFSITNQISGRFSQCTFTIPVGLPGGVEPSQRAEVIVYNDIKGTTEDDKLFRGFIVSIVRRQVQGHQTDVTKLEAFWDITCNGVEILLDNVIVNGTWTAETDHDIIVDAFTTFLPAIDTSNVIVQTSTINFSAKDQTMTQFMQSIAQVSGALWFVDQNLQLWYYASGFIIAPFGFADVPNTGSGGF